MSIEATPAPSFRKSRSALILTFMGFFSMATISLAGTPPENRFPEVAKLPSQVDLPDPLVMLSGTRVTTKEQWMRVRRPELVALFEHYMYGHAPPAPATVAAVIEREDARLFDGRATKKEVTLTVGPPDCPKIHLLLIVPNARKGPAPVFLGMNFCGNHALLKDATVALPTCWMYDKYPGVKDHRATEAGRGSQSDVWAIEQSIERGYAVATFYNGDIDPDRPDVREGIQGHFARGKYDWGTIAAWAWGLQRVVDYLVTNHDIDKDRIAVVGHSRLGKAALLAGGVDERIALIIAHQAGCGGSALSRSKVGESVKQINDHFPHWFSRRFKEFNDHPDRLPFDQHCLVAIAAPRPVLFTNAVEDVWANPAGQFDVLQAADAVYRLLELPGIDARETPPTSKLVDSPLGYHMRAGGHAMGKSDWLVFLEFADKHLPKARQATSRPPTRH